MRDGFVGERSIILPQMIIDMEMKDPLVSSLYITDIGYYPHADNHYRTRMTPIDQHVLIYCVKGEGWFKIGNKKCKVEENQYFILPAGKRHSYGTTADNPWTIYWIHFCGSHANIYAQDASTPQDVEPGVTSRIFERNNIFEEIFRTLENGYCMENLRYASSLLHHYLASLRYLVQFREAPKKGINTDDIAMALVHYMKENIDKKITLKQLAEYAGYSQSYVFVIFHDKLQMSPTNYFNKMKIDYACRLLETTDMKINQICFKVGIEDTYYFSRLFKSFKDVSPKKYRDDFKLRDMEQKRQE